MSKTIPTGAALGADITEIDLHFGDASETVLTALHHHLVVQIRGANIDDLALTRFASRFGQLEGFSAFSRSRPCNAVTPMPETATPKRSKVHCLCAVLIARTYQVFPLL